MFNVRSARSMFNIALFVNSIMLEMDSKPSISVSCNHRHAGRPQEHDVVILETTHTM